MRSYYLDDMDVNPGDQVRCKANLSSPWFDVDRIYMVISKMALLASDGTVFENPSARFQKVD